MTPRETSTDHIFNAIRRTITDEFPDLTLLFIICGEGQQSESFEIKKQEISKHPAAHLLIRHTERLIKSHPPEHFGTCFVEETEKSAFGLIKKQQALAACFINERALKHFEDKDFACKVTAYTGAFEAVHLYLQSKDRKNEQLKEVDTTRLKINALRTKLMADCFAAMILESSGIKNATQTVTKKYCEHTLSTTTDFHPENHPLPMALDGLNVVYKDLKNQTPPKTGLIKHTHFMALEIGNTYDDISLKQWIRFSLGVQDMAWGGYSSNDILSAAVYGSDSPYIRSTAHICAETLNTTPVPLKDSNIYNPFSEEDANERTHMRACKITFIALLERVNETGDPSLFLEKAREQTKKLFEFRPMGWCAPALIEAENAYRLFKETPTAEEEMIDNAFQAAFAQVKWKDLKTLNRRIIGLSRQGVEVGPEQAIAIMGDDETYAPYKNAFEILK